VAGLGQRLLQHLQRVDGGGDHRVGADQPGLDQQGELEVGEAAALAETPEQPTAPAPPEPSAQPNWLLASLGGFAAGLALAGGLAVLAARRAGRSARIQHAA
jgi:hypothetical protein